MDKTPGMGGWSGDQSVKERITYINFGYTSSLVTKFLPCFNDLTGNICIGVLTEGFRMIYIGQHTDVLLLKKKSKEISYN